MSLPRYLCLSLSLTVAALACQSPDQKPPNAPAISTSGDQALIQSLVAQLSWASVQEECNWVWVVAPKGDVALELVSIGKPATAELLNALLDPNRVIPAQLILIQIWRPSEGFSFEIDDVHGVPFKYRTGVLRWSSSTRENFDIPAAMMRENYEWWLKYTSDHHRETNEIRGPT